MRGGEHARRGSKGDLRACGGERRHSWGTQSGAASALWVKPWGLSPPWDVGENSARWRRAEGVQGGGGPEHLGGQGLGSGCARWSPKGCGA